MKHDWEVISAPIEWDDKFETFRICSKKRFRLHDTVKICKICGKMQMRNTEHEWMRVIGYRWIPLVGRCKGIKQT